MPNQIAGERTHIRGLLERLAGEPAEYGAVRDRETVDDVRRCELAQPFHRARITLPA